ncbi:DUF636 domain protein [Artomyces pyxidatus]|uniref:DUF636 domain protein n=1 Tax=Artomyces pyxidatus TaxID=48021 RepID=A0ACB8SY23_9AGAM|nr:DUF636 domain protein [Artomyces pyxidatus]
MPTYTGGCYCGDVRYEINLGSPDDARTSICHCGNCKKFFGSAFGLTAKVPKDTFKVVKGSTKKHVSPNGSSTLHREFCMTCGSGVLEYGEQAAGHSRYVAVGTLDAPSALPPKGEFFCENREMDA